MGKKKTALLRAKNPRVAKARRTGGRRRTADAVALCKGALTDRTYTASYRLIFRVKPGGESPDLQL